MYAFVLIVVAVVLLFGGLFHMMEAVAAKEKPRAVTPVEKKPVRSLAARKLITDFNALPESNRPPYDIVAIVEALDTKHGINNVDNHFGNVVYSWQCQCDSDRRANINATPPNKVARPKPVVCPMQAYADVGAALRDIERELSLREKALQRKSRQDVLDGLVPTLNQLDALTADLRREKEAIATITREYL